MCSTGYIASSVVHRLLNAQMWKDKLQDRMLGRLVFMNVHTQKYLNILYVLKKKFSA